MLRMESFMHVRICRHFRNLQAKDGPAPLLDKNGKILIGSNRIHESIVLYRIDQETGYMKELGYYPAMGLTPALHHLQPGLQPFLHGKRGQRYDHRDEA